MTYMTATNFDYAIDFAYNYRNSIPFCGKLIRRYELTGHLTEKQILALIKIRNEHLQKLR